MDASCNSDAGEELKPDGEISSPIEGRKFEDACVDILDEYTYYDIIRSRNSPKDYGSPTGMQSIGTYNKE
jgi:hypothetical protein